LNELETNFDLLSDSKSTSTIITQQEQEEEGEQFVNIFLTYFSDISRLRLAPASTALIIVFRNPPFSNS
jgi:hypothetical protein